MAITYDKPNPDQKPKSKKKNGHTKAAAPTISLDQPGRLRICNLMSIFGVSHSTLYARIAANKYPPPDGTDGNFRYWNTETIRKFLAEPPVEQTATRHWLKRKEKHVSALVAAHQAQILASMTREPSPLVSQ